MSTKPSAAAFAQAGFKYLGIRYSTMDCQAFVERCMKDVGIAKDLPGSNSWYRAMTWVGSPEECKARFGCIPVGALIFILEQDGKEPVKFQSDGIGNASHIGIKTDTGMGAIHSSQSKGFVMESAFQDKTIRNGGWNRIGLWNAFDYGERVNAILAQGSNSGVKTVSRTAVSNQTTTQKGGSSIMETNYPAKVIGGGLNLRAEQSKGSKQMIQIPNDTTITVTVEEGDWAQTSYGGKTGWVLKQYLQRTEETVTIPKKQLEAVYDTLGDWLGMRG